MSEEHKPLGIMADPSGDISSGRVMKMQAFWTAIALTVVGFATSIVLGLLGKSDIAAQLQDYILISAGMYLAVATGAEVMQKATGK
jgi:hypothetical protein